MTIRTTTNSTHDAAKTPATPPSFLSKPSAPKPSARSLIKDPVRYKTVMCENWTKHGSCPYDFKCQFAHGPHELRKRETTKDQKKPSPQTAAKMAPRRGRVSFIEELLLPRKSTTPVVDATPESTEVATPMCSPCSSRGESPPPVETVATSPPAPPPILLSAPPGLLAKPPGLASTPPGLGLPSPPVLVAPKAAAAPIDFTAAGGAAARFAAPSAAAFGQVPADVRALWGPETGESSPLRCNRTTGKVEAAMPATPAVPWVMRKMSSAGDLVRRSISFIFDEPSDRSAPPGSKRMLSNRSLRRSELDEFSELSLSRASIPSAEPYPEWA